MRFRGVLRASYCVHVSLQFLLVCLIAAQLLLILHFEHVEVSVFRILEPFPRIQTIVVGYGLLGSVAMISLVIGKLLHESRNILTPLYKVVCVLIYIAVVPLVVMRHIKLFVRRRK